MATTRINTTLSGSGVNPKKWTFSAWVKRGSLSDGGKFFAAYDGGNYYHDIKFSTEDRLVVYCHNNGNAGNLKTSRRFRDMSLWYHIVVNWDTAQSDQEDRCKVWVNNERITEWSSPTYPAQNVNGTINDGYVHTIGAGNTGSYGNYFIGCISHVHFAGNQSYDPTTFGEIDATDGMWKIKTSPTVTYTENGFFLKMEDASNLDLDSSGQNRSFTTTGTLTATKDNPDNCFATFNPLFVDDGGAKTFTNGNTTVTETANSWTSAHSSLMATTGKYYCETKLVSFSGGSASYVGASSNHSIQSKTSVGSILGTDTGSVGYYASSGNVDKAGASASYGATWGAGNIIGTAIDLDNNFIYFSKDGVWQNSGDPTSGATGTGGVALPSGMTGEQFIGFSVSPNESVMAVNFGNGYFQTTAISSAGTNASNNGSFEYDVPAGYGALCTKQINN